MYEPVFRPGLHFYIMRLDGTLSYTLTVPGKPDKHGELNETDFEDAQDHIKDEELPTEAGKDASAVGLELKLVKNIGLLTMTFEGKDGGKATWTFQGLKELGQGDKMYASVGTQAAIATLVIKGTKSTQKPLLDARLKRSLRLKNARITAVIGEAQNGASWKIVPSGVTTRLPKRSIADTCKDQAGKLSVDERMTPRKKSRPDHEEELSVGERLALRKRAKTQALPPYLFLEGRAKGVGDQSLNFADGKLYVDVQSRRVGFEPDRTGLPSKKFDPHPLNTVRWDSSYDEVKIQREGCPFFVLACSSFARAGGSKVKMLYRTHDVPINDFIEVLRKCLIPAGPTQEASGHDH